MSWRKVRKAASNVAKAAGDVVNVVGHVANTVYKEVVPDKVQNAYNTSVGGDSSVGKIVDKTGQVVQRQAEATVASTLATAKAFVKKPLPYVATFGLSQFLPYSVATGLVNAVRTGDYKAVVIDMGMSYASEGINSFFGSGTLGKIGTGLSTAALRTKLGGGSDRQVAEAGVAGAMGSLTTSILTKPKDQGGFGLKPEDITYKMVNNATTAATRAILGGRSVGDAVVESAMVTGGSFAVGKAYENVTKNSETLQTVQKKFDDAKQKVKDIWESKPNLASDHEKMVLAAQAAKNAADHAMLANSFAKNLSQKYVDGETFDIDQVNRMTKYAEDLYDSAIRHSQEYDAAKGNYEREAISSGYAQAETDFDTAHFDVRVADTALLESQKEFTSAYQDYDDTVSTVESFTNSEIAQLAAENINAEIMEARGQLAEMEQNIAEGPAQFESQEEFEARTNPQTETTLTPRQEAEQDALVKSAQAYTQTPEEAKQQRLQDEANRIMGEHLENERLRQEAYAKAEANLSYGEKFARDNPELAMNEQLNWEREQQALKDAEAKAEADKLLSPREKLYRDDPEQYKRLHAEDVAELYRQEDEARNEAGRKAAEEKEAERERQMDAAYPNTNWREQERLADEQAERWKDPYVKEQDLAQMRENEQRAQVEAANKLKEQQEAERARVLDATYPNWREQERLAEEQAARYAKNPEFRELDLAQIRENEQRAQVEAAEEAKKQLQAQRERELDAANPNWRQQEAEANAQAALFAKYPEMRQEFNREQDRKREAAERQKIIDEENANLAKARENQKIIDEQRAQLAEQAAKDAAEAEAEDKRRMAKFLEEYQRKEFENSPEGIRQAQEKQALEKARLDEQHKAEVLAAEQRAKEKRDADALAEHNAQVKAAEDARVAASKTTTQPATATPTTTEPKQTEIGATITKIGTSAFNAALAKKIAEDKADKAREEALAKQAQLRAEAIARQEAAKAKAKADYDEKVRIAKEFQEKAKADALAKAKADYDAKVKAQLEAKAVADAKAKAEYDEKVRLKAEYDAKVKAQADAKAAAYAKAKAEHEAKAKADYDAKTAAYAVAKAAYDEKVRLKAEYDAKVKAQADAKAKAEAFAKAQADIKAAAAAKAKAESDAIAAAENTGTEPPVISTTGGLPTVAPTGTLTPVTKPTGTLTPVTTSVTPTGGLNTVSTTTTAPVTKPATNLPTTPTSTTIAKPTGTLTPVVKPPTGLTPVVPSLIKPPTGTLTPVTKPTGTLTPVTKPAGTLTPVAKPTGTLTPAIKPTGALTSVIKPSGTLTPV